MKETNFTYKHPKVSPSILEIGKIYQYKEDWHIYHCIFLGWDEDEEYYTWKIKFVEGPSKDEEIELRTRKDMTGYFYSGMFHIYEKNTYHN